jgi:hypothetical protein
MPPWSHHSVRRSIVRVAEVLLWRPSSVKLPSCPASTVFLVGLFLGVPRRYVSVVGRFLVAAGLWWRLRLRCCLIGCGGCWFARARVSTGPATYPALYSLFLPVDCNSYASHVCVQFILVSWINILYLFRR